MRANRCKLVSYSRWSNVVPEVFQAAKKETTHTSGIHVSDEIRSKVYSEIRRILDNPELNIKPEMSLAFDLGMDSLNIAESIAFLIKNFSVTEIHPEDLETVGTILEIAQGGKRHGRQRRRHRRTHGMQSTNGPLPHFPAAASSLKRF